MASVRSTIELVITGATRGLGAAAAEARAMAARIAEAEDRVSDARRRSAEAESRVAETEARLNQARRSGDLDAVRVAEERLAQARGRAFRASEDLARAERDLQVARRRGTTDIDRQRSGLLGLFDALSRLGDAFTGADGASTSFLAKMAALNSVFSSIGGPIVQAVVGILQFVAVLATAGEIIGVVGGLIGQVFAGIPAVLLAAGAAAATVALGMDGIKKAAQAAEPAFTKLKAAISGTFFSQLQPAFVQLGRAIPEVAVGFERVAVAISEVVKQIIAVVTSAQGLTTINSILNGTAVLFRALAPGVAVFVKGLLDAANIGSPAMQRLGEALAAVLNQIGGIFTRLAGSGVIQQAVLGLASTIQGLGNVLGPVIEALIRMGAALGLTLGGALTELGNLIQTSIPFFEHLAQVAGDLLVTAFKEWGSALGDVITQLLPGANQGLDGFAAVIKNTVIPAVRDFIRAIPGMLHDLKLFFLSATEQALSFASSMLAAFSSILGVLHDFFFAMALIPGPMQESFGKAAAATEGFKTKVDETRVVIDKLHGKTIKLELQTIGVDTAKVLQETVDGVRDKVVTLLAHVFGKKETDDLKTSQDSVTDKSVTMTATVLNGPVLGTLGNQLLKNAIDNVPDKTTTTTGNVPEHDTLGRRGNQLLSGAIGDVNDKTVTVRANVFGTDAVRAMVNAIDAVHDASATVTTYLRTLFISAMGSFLTPQMAVGMAGGGKLTPMSGSFARIVGPNTWRVIGDRMINDEAFIPINKSARSKRILTLTAARMGFGLTPMAAGGQVGGGTVGGGGAAPIEVRVFIGDQELKGLVRTEIADRDRATKRTVLAGSGVSF